MRALYRAYCRSCTQANCSPAFLGVALVILVIAFGVRQFIATHESAIVHGFLITAATVLCVIAAALLVQAMRTVVAAVGQHHAPACAVPPRRRTRPATAPAGTVPIGADRDGAPVGYTWKINPPAPAAPEPGPAPALFSGDRLPGKSDLVTPHVSDMKAMAADADALRAGDLDVLVTERGSIFELAEQD